MQNNFEILRQNDKAAAAEAAGEYLNSLLTENGKQSVLLMLSGGSALEILDHLGEHVLGENLTVSMLDERFSHDLTINNFAQLQKTDFYHVALESGVSFYGSLPRKEENMEQLAARWESNLENWYAENPTGIIIATLGMGADGHTAGMFPYPEDSKKFDQLFKDGNWLTAYNAGNKNQYSERITTNLEFFKLIDFAVAFACGPEKKEKLEQAVKNQGTPNELPALLWHEIANVKVFTDNI